MLKPDWSTFGTEYKSWRENLVNSERESLTVYKFKNLGGKWKIQKSREIIVRKSCELIVRKFVKSVNVPILNLLYINLKIEK